MVDNFCKNFPFQFHDPTTIRYHQKKIIALYDLDLSYRNIFIEVTVSKNTIAKFIKKFKKQVRRADFQD